MPAGPQGGASPARCSYAAPRRFARAKQCRRHPEPHAVAGGVRSRNRKNAGFALTHASALTLPKMQRFHCGLVHTLPRCTQAIKRCAVLHAGSGKAG